MPMTREEQIASNIIKYSAHRQYYGRLNGAQLTHAKNALRELEYGCHVSIEVGGIDGDVICNTLWNQMSYNPLRFGTVSPFVFSGKNNIYRFVNNTPDVQVDNVAMGIIGELRNALCRYLAINAAPNRQWRDVIETNNGRVDIGDTSSAVCRALTQLQDCVRCIIAPQNGSDFRGRVAYRRTIVSQLMAMYPAAFNPKTK